MRSLSSVTSHCGVFLRPLVNPDNPTDQSVWQLVVRLLAVVMLLATPLQRALAADSGKQSEQVVAFLTAHCKKCHGETKKEGRLTLHNINTDLASGHDLGRWQVVLDRLDAGEMPPDTEPRPDAADVRQILDWIRTGLHEAEAAGHFNTRMTKPGQGNAVRHSLLFDPRNQAVSIPSPPRVWRLSPLIYQRLVWDLDKYRKAEVFNPFPVTSAHGFSDQSAL